MAKQGLSERVDLEGPAGSMSFKNKGAVPDKSKKRTKDIELPSDEMKTMFSVKPLMMKKKKPGAENIFAKKKRTVGLS